MNGRVFIIIGNGALGTGVAALLQTLGMIPRFLSRQGACSVRATIENAPDGIFDLFLPELSPHEAYAASAVLVAVKAYQLKGALRQHLPDLPKSLPIVSIGNGAIDEDLKEIASQFPERKFRWGTTNLAVTRLGERLFSFRNPNASIAWGPLVPSIDEPEKGERLLLEVAPNIFHWEFNPLKTARKKWLFNTVLNTLAGADQAPTNASILLHRSRLELIFREAYQLGETHWGPWEEPSADLLGKLVHLIELTADNENSMAQDVRLGRRTESAYLAGISRRYAGFDLLKALHEKL